jgi:NAD(P)-dependent dehydrogenase (short-subunit alcohol dehydrogenase family)
MDEALWQHQYNTNTMGFARTIREALPHFIKQKNGAIVNISSTAAHIGEELRVGYANSKIAINTLTRHVARTWGPDNVRCNAIAPGPVISESWLEYVSKEDTEAMVGQMPLRRGGTPADVGNVIAFLLSDDGAWVTGQVWSVNGGWTLRE